MQNVRRLPAAGTHLDRLHAPTRSLALRIVYAVIAAGALVALAAVLPPEQRQPYWELAAIAGLFALTVMDDPAASSWPAQGARLIRWLVVFALALVAFSLVRANAALSPAVLAAWLLLTPFVFLLVDLVSRDAGVRPGSRGKQGRRAVIVCETGTSETAMPTVAALAGEGFQILGAFTPSRSAKAREGVHGIPLLGDTGALDHFIADEGVEAVFLLLPHHAVHETRALIDRLADTTASVYYLPSFDALGIEEPAFIRYRNLSLVAVHETPLHGAPSMFKRSVDIVVAGAALLVLSPLLLAVALAIWLTDGRPIFYAQERHGKGGKLIRVFKFRSMRTTDAPDVVRHATQNDPRVTRLGRFLRAKSIDELPQLWNVINGDMSLVGPRPHAVRHNEEYRRAIKGYMARHKVPPGITGLAQVNGERGMVNSVNDMERRVSYDLEYIREWTPMLDAKILVKTAWILWRDENAV